MTDTNEWVDVSDEITVSTAPTEAELASYSRFVQDDTAPSLVFNALGLCYVLRYPNVLSADIKAAARLSSNCNACAHRAGLYSRDAGPTGPVLFAQTPAIRSLGLSSGDTQAVTALCKLSAQTCANDVTPELVVVTSETYAPSQEGCSPCGDPFYHWTVFPSKVSSAVAAARFDKLKHYYSGQMDVRLAKLTVTEAVASVSIMLEEQSSLERPGHYAAVLCWVQGVQKFAREQCVTGDGSFEAMSHVDQARLRVLALMSGQCDGSVHLDFHQSDNIVDFCLMPSRDALRAEMDRRSDPNYYMVSQLNRKLAQAGVTSKWLIGLTWDGDFADDLDIHVELPSGKEINYNNKQADGCKLDFDANVHKGEANPCENVSVKPGTYKVRVNNFTRRTFSKPIPFQIICRQQGMDDVVYDGVWGVNRAKSSFVHVCTHTFGEVPDSTTAVSMSAKSASRASALDGEWLEHFGDPSAMIATTSTVSHKTGVEVIHCGTGAVRCTAPSAPTPRQVGRSFMDMALSTKDANARGGGTKKPFLSQSCRAQPKTVEELIEHMRMYPTAQLAVHPRDHAPGYLVSVQTKNAGVRKDDLPVPCHYQDKHAFPAKPVAGSGVGNARLDASWLSHTSTNGFVRVEAVVAYEGGSAFLALQGATLPRQSMRSGRSGGSAFPLGSGFYPTDLSAAFVKHRERWTYYHTQLQPSMPPTGSGVPLIGTFLKNEATVVYLDGIKLTLRCS